MKLGMRGHDFGKAAAPEALAAKITAAGFETIQLAIPKAIEGVGGFLDVSPALLDEIRQAFAAYHLGIAVLGSYIEPSLPEEALRLGQVEQFLKSIEHAAFLGAPVVGTETGGMAPDTPDAVREEAFQRLLDSVRRMTAHAEKHNVLVGIEPVAEHTLNTPRLARRLLDEVSSPALAFIFDPVNLLRPGMENEQNALWDEVFTLLGDRIAAVHVKDTDMANNAKGWCPLGEGVVNYRMIFDWLKTNKPDIALLREEVRPESAERDLRFLKEMSS